MILILSYRRKSWVHHSTLDPVQNLIYFSGPKNDQKMIHYCWIQKKWHIVDPLGPLNYTHLVYLIFIHKDFTRFQNQSFWSGSQVVLHLLLSRSWMLFALEKLAAAAALDLALPSHNTMGSKYSWIRICDFKFLWFHEKNASDLSKAESFKKYYRAKNPRICSPNILSYFSSGCKVCIFLISTVILAFFGLFWS